MSRRPGPNDAARAASVERALDHAMTLGSVTTWHAGPNGTYVVDVVGAPCGMFEGTLDETAALTIGLAAGARLRPTTADLAMIAGETIGDDLPAAATGVYASTMAKMARHIADECGRRGWAR